MKQSAIRWNLMAAVPLVAAVFAMPPHVRAADLQNNAGSGTQMNSSATTQGRGSTSTQAVDTRTAGAGQGSNQGTQSGSDYRTTAEYNGTTTHRTFTHAGAPDAGCR